MLVVEDPIQSEDALLDRHKSFNIDEFIWPHGITPPLHHVRKRRFRKRISRRVSYHCVAPNRILIVLQTIETVEEEVERLLEADENAEEVKYGMHCFFPNQWICIELLPSDVLENVNPDLSDSEFQDREETMDPMTPGFGGSEAGDMPTPGGDHGEGDGERDERDEEGEEEEGDIDEDLAAELDLALGDDDGENDGDEEDEDEDESDDEDEDDDDDEAVQAKKLLNEEIRDLEAAVAKKNHEIASSANPLIRVRCFPYICRCMRLT